MWYVATIGAIVLFGLAVLAFAACMAAGRASEAERQQWWFDLEDARTRRRDLSVGEKTASLGH